MLFADEVISPDSFDEVPVDGDVKSTKRELQMAKQLIDSLVADFEPDKYRDEYRDRVLDLIERKAQGETVVIEPTAEEPKEVPDLMAALEASIAAAKSPGADGASEKKAKSELEVRLQVAQEDRRQELAWWPPAGSRWRSRAGGCRCPTSTR